MIRLYDMINIKLAQILKIFVNNFFKKIEFWQKILGLSAIIII